LLDNLIKMVGRPGPRVFFQRKSNWRLCLFTAQPANDSDSIFIYCL